MLGDIVIALADVDVVSVGSPFQPGPNLRVLVAIKSDRLPPLTLPNVARNVIAHELGHAIGLGHNNDAKTLMCGRPAECRPDAWQSSVERYFPLLEQEKAFLKKLYPPSS
jgi:hypothetical protein